MKQLIFNEINRIKEEYSLFKNLIIKIYPHPKWIIFTLLCLVTYTVICFMITEYYNEKNIQ